VFFSTVLAVFPCLPLWLKPWLPPVTLVRASERGSVLGSLRDTLKDTLTWLKETCHVGSIQNRTKTDKPYSDFPLYAHPSGRWCKTINGRKENFGPWKDWRGALVNYQAWKDELYAGRGPIGNRPPRPPFPTHDRPKSDPARFPLRSGRDRFPRLTRTFLT
jgi:hypothetical protein